MSSFCLIALCVLFVALAEVKCEDDHIVHIKVPDKESLQIHVKNNAKVAELVKQVVEEVKKKYGLIVKTVHDVMQVKGEKERNGWIIGGDRTKNQSATSITKVNVTLKDTKNTSTQEEASPEVLEHPQAHAHSKDPRTNKFDGLDVEETEGDKENIQLGHENGHGNQHKQDVEVEPNVVVD